MVCCVTNPLWRYTCSHRFSPGEPAGGWLVLVGRFSPMSHKREMDENHPEHTRGTPTMVVKTNQVFCNPYPLPLFPVVLINENTHPEGQVSRLPSVDPPSRSRVGPHHCPLSSRWMSYPFERRWLDMMSDATLDTGCFVVLLRFSSWT